MSTHVRDIELVNMAAFKLEETARRVAILAREAQTPGLRRLLTASSARLERQAQELRVCLDTGGIESQPLTPPLSRPRDRVATRLPASA